MNGVGKRRHVRPAQVGPSLRGRKRKRERERESDQMGGAAESGRVWQCFIFYRSFYTLSQYISKGKIVQHYISLFFMKPGCFLHISLFMRVLYIIFWPWGLLTFYASQVNVNLFSVSVVTLTERQKSHRATEQSRSITLLTQKVIVLQELPVAFI